MYRCCDCFHRKSFEKIAEEEELNESGNAEPDKKTTDYFRCRFPNFSLAIKWNVGDRNDSLLPKGCESFEVYSGHREVSMPPKQRKIAIMGFRSVGKSSLAYQFVYSQFIDYYDPTIEQTLTKNLKIQGQDYCISIVDTRGQEEHSMFPTAYAMDIHGYCFVYSIDNRKSFEVVKIVYEKLIDTTGPVTIPIILVGNKLDLKSDRNVSFDQGKQLAQYMKAQFMEVSAKNNTSVNDLFRNLILSIESAERRNERQHESSSKCTIS